MLAAGARLRGDRRLARQSRFVTLGALGVSTALLIKDLGRPERFYNMMRVLKPTSPMSIGSWVLGAFGTAAAAGTASDVLDVFPGLGALADTAAGGIPPARCRGRRPGHRSGRRTPSLRHLRGREGGCPGPEVRRGPPTQRGRRLSPPVPAGVRTAPDPEPYGFA